MIQVDIGLHVNNSVQNNDYIYFVFTSFVSETKIISSKQELKRILLYKIANDVKLQLFIFEI